MDKSGVLERIKKDAWPALTAERERLSRIDNWLRWDHDKPYAPQQTTREYKDLASRAQAPWGRRVVTAVTDQLYIEGYRGKGEGEDATPWEHWQANGLDGRQIAVHEAAVAYGLSYNVVLPGKSFTGDDMPVIRGLDPSQMIAFYEDPAWDDWPVYALRAEGTKIDGKPGWLLRVYDDQSVHYLHANAEGGGLTWLENREHGIGVCPVVRFANHLDLRARADGEVEPFIPLLGRIDQTTFDRLIVQRFASWKVRTLTGMAEPDTLEGEDLDTWRTRVAQTLKVNDMLIAADPDAKFGSLPETSLDGFINAHDADVRALAAVSQTPVHELLGQMANLSAEALAAAEASLTRKVENRRHTLGESWEQTLRLAALVAGDREAARDVGSQVHWKDMESRSLAQAADALGKIAEMLHVPVEMLWEKIPGWTQQDVDRAKALAAEGGDMEQLLATLVGGVTPPEPAPNG